jgi:hypothetical protein
LKLSDNWSEHELRAAVDAYVDMSAKESQGIPFVKKKYYSDLSKRFGRTEKSFEFRMQNISYMYSLMGRDWVSGLKPAKNVGAKNASIIKRLISEVEGLGLPKIAGVETLEFSGEHMNSYLLSWNPDKWEWEQLTSDSEKVMSGGIVEMDWSVTKNNKPAIGDKFYLIKVGKQGRGIIACGTILTEPYDKAHYDSEKKSTSQPLKYVRIKFDLLVDGNNGNYLVTEIELNRLNELHNIDQHWTPENSGISINVEAAKHLESIVELSKERYVIIGQDSYCKSIEELDELDSKYNALRRNEQGYLRSFLFGSSKYAECCICRELYPVEFLVAAHIKKRSVCNNDEKKDFKNIVVSMCKFGCDELFERGHISVVEGIVVSNNRLGHSDALNSYRDKTVDNICVAFNVNNRKYFEFHYRSWNP